MRVPPSCAVSAPEGRRSFARTRDRGLFGRSRKHARQSAGGEPNVQRVGLFGKKRGWRRTIYYEQFDAAYAAMAPARWSAAATRAVFENPLNPFSYTVPGRM